MKDQINECQSWAVWKYSSRILGTRSSSCFCFCIRLFKQQLPETTEAKEQAVAFYSWSSCFQICRISSCQFAQRRRMWRFEICLILSLSLSRTGPGDVSTCKLPVCCLKPDLKKPIYKHNSQLQFLFFERVQHKHDPRTFFFAFSTQQRNPMSHNR